MKLFFKKSPFFFVSSSSSFKLMTMKVKKQQLCQCFVVHLFILLSLFALRTESFRFPKPVKTSKSPILHLSLFGSRSDIEDIAKQASNQAGRLILDGIGLLKLEDGADTIPTFFVILRHNCYLTGVESKIGSRDIVTQVMFFHLTKVDTYMWTISF